MRVLITGMSGFAGNALADHLLRETHWMLIGISSTTDGERISPRVQWWKLDLRNADSVRRLLKYERPDLIFHLAAQASIPRAWENAWETYEINVQGTLNLFEAIIGNKITPRILVVSSNEVYGAPADVSELPFKEGHLLRPNNPYGVSKVAQETLALQYRYSHGLDVVIVRPFNHIGPNQRANYAISGLARKIAEIEAGLCEPVMGVGNMQAQRDFTDVRDIARAYYEVARLADGGSLYNVCSGTPRSIQHVFDQLLAMSQAHITVQTDTSKFRVVDTPISYGDPMHLTQDIGWQPQIPLQQTLADVLAYWRQRVGEEAQSGHPSEQQRESRASSDPSNR